MAIPLIIACCILVAVLTLSYLRSRRKIVSSKKLECTLAAPAIPGPTRKDVASGNLEEIGAAGSLHCFLSRLHMRHGTVAGFWMGKEYVISVASPSSFKKLVHIFDRPPNVFKSFLPLFGRKSLAYANSDDGRLRRQLYDRAYGHRTMPQYFSHLKQVADEVVDKWSKADANDHFPLHRTMLNVALKSIAITAFGEYFQDDRLLTKLQDSYEACWSCMEQSLANGFPSEGTEAFNSFQAGLHSLHSTVADIIAKRQSEAVRADGKILFDYLLEWDDSEERIFDDSITYMVGGFHTTGNLLTWALYYLARNQDIQEKLFSEINTVLGDVDIDENNVAGLRYLRQVQDETMRCSVLAPWAARALENDIELDGYVIPAKTPIYIALIVMLKDSAFWPDPERFDPERFNPENSRKRPLHVFSPFGLAGKRICPGYRFAYFETAITLATLVRRFRIHLVDNHDVKPSHGLVTSVSEEVWVSVTPR